jgi:prepilin-type N-terminal cleavage/methylation domain-containing protein
MKKQNGFTLIELLLVLAIIGIISAIAIPALLGQRARARDKSAIANCDGIVSDLVAGYDKAKEAGTAMATPAAFQTAVLGTAAAPLVSSFWLSTNPWTTANALPAYKQTVATETDTTAAVVIAAATATTLGQVQVGFFPPAANVAGCVDASVWVNSSFKNGTGNSVNNYTKIAGLD